MNETPAKLAAALAAAQAELPSVTKNRTADVIGKDGRRLYAYSYADLADVSAAILPILGKHGLAFTSFPGHQENGKFGLRYYLMHSSGESIDGFWEIGDQGGMQVTGGRITYARRYCLCAVTGVTAEEDVDARDDGQARRPKQQPANGNGDQQPARTAQRKPRATDASPAGSRTPAGVAAPAGSAGEALPPLPGEEGAPGLGAPDETDYDSPRTVTDPQIRAIVTILSKVFAVDDDEQARTVCAHIARTGVKTRKNLSRNQAANIIDTLSDWHKQAKKEDMDPRTYMFARMAAEEAEREQDQAGEPDGR